MTDEPIPTLHVAAVEHAVRIAIAALSDGSPVGDVAQCLAVVLDRGAGPAPVAVARALQDTLVSGEEGLESALRGWLTDVQALHLPQRRGLPTVAWSWPGWLRHALWAAGWVAMGVGLMGVLREAHRVPVAAAQVVRLEPARPEEGALRFVNDAPPEILRRVGVYPRGVKLIVDHRPFPTWEAFVGTPGIGPATERAVRLAAAQQARSHQTSRPSL